MKINNFDGLGRIIYYEPEEFRRLISSDPLPERENDSIEGDYGFTKTHSYQEALDLLKYGDDESYKLLKKVRKENGIDEMENSLRKRKRVIQDVAGFQPIVPNAILGLPKSMLNSNYDLSRKKIVRIYFDAGIQWSVGANEMALAGAKIMSYIDTLEYNDYRVELYMGNTHHVGYSSSSVKNQGWIFPVKSASQPLNVRKLCFYFINPSFLRRIGFRVDEAESNLVDVTDDGYGNNSHIEERASLVFKSMGDDINYYGFDVMQDKEFTTNLEEVKEQLGI